MGYPMTFTRLIGRNGLGDFRESYDGGTPLHGDLLRWVENTQDVDHVEFFARISGATPDQIRTVFALVFDDQHHLTVNGMPLGRHASIGDIEAVEGLPSGEELTRTAERKRIAELEEQVIQLEKNFEWAIERWRADGRPNPDGDQAALTNGEGGVGGG